MNPQRHNRSRSHASRLLFAVILATLSMLSALVPPAGAQITPGSQLATQFFDAVGSGSQMDLLATGAVLHSPLGTYTGADGPAQFGRELRESFSYVEFSTKSIETVGPQLIVRFTLTAVHTGTYNGLVANCGGITVPGVAVIRFANLMVVTEDPNTGALGQYLDPTYVVQAHVTEQWISYDKRLIERQITAPNSIPETQRENCFDWPPSQSNWPGATMMASTGRST